MILESLRWQLLNLHRHHILLSPLLTPLLLLLFVFVFEGAPSSWQDCALVWFRHLELPLDFAEKLAGLGDREAFQTLLTVELHLELLGASCLLFGFQS